MFYQSDNVISFGCFRMPHFLKLTLFNGKESLESVFLQLMQSEIARLKVIPSSDTNLKIIFHIQWVPLTGIMDNVINRLMVSNYPDLQVPNYTLITNIGWNSFAYRYYLVNGISYGLAQSDPIKRRPLYQIGSKNLQLTPLYVITLGHQELDNINRMITVTGYLYM